MYDHAMTEKLLTRFRYADRADAQALADIFATSWRQAYRGIIPFRQLERTLRHRDANWWASSLARGARPIVMSFDDVLIGYATAGPARRLPASCGTEGVGEIFELYLSPDYQGVGFGTRLFASARAQLKKRSHASLVVWALSDNFNACEFYRNLGGRPIARSVEPFGGIKLARTAFAWTSI